MSGVIGSTRIFMTTFQSGVTIWEVWRVSPAYIPGPLSLETTVYLINEAHSRSMARDTSSGMIGLMVSDSVPTNSVVIVGTIHHHIVLLNVYLYPLFRPFEVAEVTFPFFTIFGNIRASSFLGPLEHI